MPSHVDALFTIGQPDKLANWPDYPERYKLDASHIPDLIQLLTQQPLPGASAAAGKHWVPLHAWRALGQLRANDAVPVIFQHIEIWARNDWAIDEIPSVLALIGEPAIAPANAVLVSSRFSEGARIIAMKALVQTAGLDPLHKEQVYPLLSRYAQQPDHSVSALNALLVNELEALDSERFHREVRQLLLPDLVDIELIDPEILAAVLLDGENEPLLSGDDELFYPEGENPDPLDILDYYLNHYGGEDAILNVSELEGFFAALACSPDVIMPSRWLPHIWGGEDKMPDWEDQKEIAEFHELLMQFNNDILDQLVEGTFAPLFYEGEFQGRNVLLVDDWCRGFLFGLTLYGPVSESDGAEIERRTAPIRMFDIPANLEALAQLDMAELCDLQDSIEPNVTALFHHFMGRRVAEARTPYMNTELSVGRNDPCPCGSGKKFKKCCLH